MDYDINGKLVNGSDGPTYKWYGDGDPISVENYIKNPNRVVATINNNNKVTDFYHKGEILKIGSNYYIVTEDGTQTIDGSQRNNQTFLETLNLVKITGIRNNYWHENGFSSDTKNQYADPTPFVAADNAYANRKYSIRGVPITLDTGEIYIYVGKTTPWEFTGINDTDFIKVRDRTIEEWSFY